MWKRITEVMIAAGLIVLMGCVSVQSLNVQRSALRGAGDAGTTALLERQDEVDADGVAEGIKNICNDVLFFLDDGNVNLLTKGELRAALLRVVPEESAKFVDDLLSLVSMARVDVGFVGRRNIRRIKAFVIGVIRGADEYDVGDRE